MRRTPARLREDALAIWRAGLAAVDSERLVRENVRVEGGTLHVADEEIPLADIGRIAVVGAGKAGAGMAAGIEAALGAEWMAAKDCAGRVNVPADCLRPLSRIALHAARPAGVNEPTAEGVEGTQRILELVALLGENDLCLCLISGGGSALLPAPAEGVSLADKQRVTRFLSAAGANIEELNTVRKRLSRVKGGGLARACRGGRLISLIISDVLGDSLDIIASGPTVADEATAAEALAVLAKFDALDRGVPRSVFDVLEAQTRTEAAERPAEPAGRVSNHIIGNLAVAVDAAGIEAERRGYSHAMHAATRPEGFAEDVGRHMADMALRMNREAGPDCLITGGEPVVELVEESQRGKGGRNQQLALAALLRMREATAGDLPEDIVLLSGGTDGEDGPTDAAGAILDAGVLASLREAQLDPADYLRRNDAWHFFDRVGGLIRTGPTHTNVCDLRVAVVGRVEREDRS